MGFPNPNQLFVFIFIQKIEMSRFLKSDNGRGIDTNRADLSTQGEAIRNITGFVSGIGRVRFDGYYGAFYDTGSRDGEKTQINGQSSSNCNDDFAFDASRVVPTASENRPKNISVMYIIKNG